MCSLSSNDTNSMSTPVIKLPFEAAVRMERWHLEMIVVGVAGQYRYHKNLPDYMAERQQGYQGSSQRCSDLIGQSLKLDA